MTPIHLILSGKSAEDDVSYLLGDPARLFWIQDLNYKLRNSPFSRIYTIAYSVSVLGINGGVKLAVNLGVGSSRSHSPFLPETVNFYPMIRRLLFRELPNCPFPLVGTWV